MTVTRLSLRSFRSYAAADVRLGERITVVHGRNGAGKTNLLEALYFACTGRGCRTSADRELLRWGEKVARVELALEAEDGPHELSVGIEPGERRIVRADGARVDRLLDLPVRPLAGVFLPDRLELVKGAPSLRRAHLDQVVAALWPARADARREYGRALAQRNALLGRVRAGAASPESLATWEAQLGRLGVALMATRRDALDALAAPFAAIAAELGLEGEVGLRYRPRSQAVSAAELAGELAERRARDLERGFTEHGPHRDEIVLSRDGRELRAYGSQGQQRLALLSLLLAERATIAGARGRPPLMLLDDVMSELDAERRERLMAVLGDSGQTVITATEVGHVPGADGADVVAVGVEIGPDGSSVLHPRLSVLRGQAA